MTYWFTSDYHLGHANIIKYCNRPFRDVEHMNKTIIRNHNERVKEGDIVFHIGDFCFRNSSGGKEGEGGITRATEWENELNGKIIHVKGNHDGSNSIKTIIQGILINYCGEDVYLVHKPEHYNPKYKINFVGHVHTAWHSWEKPESKLINVGVDMNKFMPLTFQEVMRIS